MGAQGRRNRSGRPVDCQTNVWVYRPEIYQKCSYSIHRTLVNIKHLTLEQILAHSARLLKSMGHMRCIGGTAKKFARTQHITCLINRNLLPPALVQGLSCSDSVCISALYIWIPHLRFSNVFLVMLMF